VEPLEGARDGRIVEPKRRSHARYVAVPEAVLPPQQACDADAHVGHLRDKLDPACGETLHVGDGRRSWQVGAAREGLQESSLALGSGALPDVGGAVDARGRDQPRGRTLDGDQDRAPPPRMQPAEQLVAREHRRVRRRVGRGGLAGHAPAGITRSASSR
jgi:hypothetical protein